MYDILGALKALFEEVHYMDFYRDIFPEGSFEERGEYEDGKYNGIAIAIEKGSKRAKRMTITDDLDTIADMVGSHDFCLMSPISYAGKSRKSSNARFMYALAIDLDGMTERKHWDFLWSRSTVVMRCCSLFGVCRGLRIWYLPAQVSIFIMSLSSLFRCLRTLLRSWRS
mgnify:FL=1